MQKFCGNKIHVALFLRPNVTLNFANDRYFGKQVASVGKDISELFY